MLKNWKRVFCLMLSCLLLLGTMTACGAGSSDSAPASTTTAPTEPAPTEPEGEEKVLRILTLGHSLGVDCGNMLNRVFASEGTGEYEEVYIATLYYSGCPLYKHVNYLKANSPEYNLYLSSSLTPDLPPTIMDGVTMYDALKFNYWDIIIMMGGVFEIGVEETYTNGDIQTIQAYVNENKLNPNAIFAWHMPWATPINNDLRDMYPKSPNTYYSNYEKFGNSRTTFYNSITACVGKYIMTDETFQFLIPSGTALENALSSYLEETDIHRDYAHASDYGRIIASYTWYCAIMGVDQLNEVKMNDVPVKFLKNVSGGDLVLTDMQKAIILESVNNAIAEPLKMTQSQYTEAPAA